MTSPELSDRRPRHPGRAGSPAIAGMVRLLATVPMVLAFLAGLRAQPVAHMIANDAVRLTVLTENGRLVSDRLEVLPGWGADRGNDGTGGITTDADFGLDVMVTDWQAPGRANNGDNPVMFTKSDFDFVSAASADLPGGARELTLRFDSKKTTLGLELTYRIEPGDFYARKKITLSDTAFGFHYLRWLWTARAEVSGVRSVIKNGGFGQPVAILTAGGGAFFGLEYPTADNRIEEPRSGRAAVRCGQEMGMEITGEAVGGEWVVIGVTPDRFVKKWFMEYVDRIRVAPLRPYTLYNSWYDLRSPEYPRVPSEHWMGEESALRMAGLLRENMVEKHGIALDAFVLDDGWDVYESDWELRKREWPRGLKPLTDDLKKTNTSLGIWVGPTGGYSFRTRRLGWMKEHGYEVVGKTRNDMMLCLAGKKYSELFKKRVTDFVAADGAAYFKWDGIQFSCSEPDHGHPVGIYSRRAVMESLIGMCRAVREKNPATFLNITSGTWLSPWWVKYANTIWMQGADYGYSDVPSISRRDAAITYRDFILYDDFVNLDLWFPIANLMTHGIIKGKLQLLGTAEEPIDKFTDDVLLYFARGISMYELYISPDILNEGEWRSISASIDWAKDRFSVLRSTFMVGGNPMDRESYGYVHFAGSRGVIAARNPFIGGGNLTVTLDPSQGMDPGASGLVLEKIYPYRWISPRLYRAGDRIDLPLDGYETAVYEVYPAAEAPYPLPAGVVFDMEETGGHTWSIRYRSPGGNAGFLNRSAVSAAGGGGAATGGPPALRVTAPSEEGRYSVRTDPADRSGFSVNLNMPGTLDGATLAVLLTPAGEPADQQTPEVSVAYDGAAGLVTSDRQEGKSHWYLTVLPSGVSAADFSVSPGKEAASWKGMAQVWLLGERREDVKSVSVTFSGPASPRPMPPVVRDASVSEFQVKIGEAALSSGVQVGAK